MSTTPYKKIRCRGPIQARVRIPGSKSFSNRAVLLAALADGTSTLHGVLDSDDLRVMRVALGAMGAEIQVSDDTWQVRGTAGRLQGGPAGPNATTASDALTLDVHASGTAARFLTAAATLASGPIRIDGTARMRQRPIGDLVETLRALGAPIDIEGSHGCPPVLCFGGGLAGGSAVVDASRSSQYVSAVLQVAPYATAPVELHLRNGQLVSRPYVDMTIDVMRIFGVQAGFKDAATLSVHSKSGYHATVYHVEPDASTAAYFFCAAAITGGRVRIDDLPGHSKQADLGVLDLLAQMGCQVERGSNFCEVQGPPGGRLAPISTDMNSLPDAVLAMAVTCLFADGESHIRNVANLRIKETDRLAALEAELRKLGAEAHAGPDFLTIKPPAKIVGAEIDTYDDHRIAMAFSLAGLLVDDVVIREPECVSKSFPGYFDLLDTL